MRMKTRQIYYPSKIFERLDVPRLGADGRRQDELQTFEHLPPSSLPPSMAHPINAPAPPTNPVRQALDQAPSTINTLLYTTASVSVIGIIQRSLRHEDCVKYWGVATNVRSKAQWLLAAGRDGAGAVSHTPRGAVGPKPRPARCAVDV